MTEELSPEEVQNMQITKEEFYYTARWYVDRTDLTVLSSRETALWSLFNSIQAAEKLGDSLGYARSLAKELVPAAKDALKYEVDFIQNEPQTALSTTESRYLENGGLRRVVLSRYSWDYYRLMTIARVAREDVIPDLISARQTVHDTVKGFDAVSKVTKPQHPHLSFLGKVASLAGMI